MSKHSPAPWKKMSFESGSVCVVMRMASGKGPPIMGPDHADADGHLTAQIMLHNVPAFIALTGATEDELTEERHANACLIAKAPLLLEALKNAHKIECGEWCGGPPHDEDCQAVSDLIAEAEGQ